MEGRKSLVFSPLERWTHSFTVGPEEASAFDLPEAPVFYPSAKEFKDPWKYLNSIRHIIWQTGICVIQPPHEEGGWDFDSFDKYIDAKNFNIVTKQQNVHQMQDRNGLSVAFARQLIRWWSEHGRPMQLLPEIHGVVVDFCRLKDLMEERGGFDKVSFFALSALHLCSLNLTTFALLSLPLFLVVVGHTLAPIMSLSLLTLSSFSTSSANLFLGI